MRDFRKDVTAEFANVRQKMSQQFAGVSQQFADQRTEIAQQFDDLRRDLRHIILVAIGIGGLFMTMMIAFLQYRLPGGP